MFTPYSFHSVIVYHTPFLLDNTYTLHLCILHKFAPQFSPSHFLMAINFFPVTACNLQASVLK